MKTYTITAQQLREIAGGLLIARFYLDAYPEDEKHEDDTLSVDQAFSTIFEIRCKQEEITA
jgi:hypothetical protein